MKPMVHDLRLAVAIQDGEVVAAKAVATKSISINRANFSPEIMIMEIFLLAYGTRAVLT